MDDISHEASGRGRTANQEIIGTVLFSLLLHIVLALLMRVNVGPSNKIDVLSNIPVASYLIVKTARLEKTSIGMMEGAKIQASGRVNQITSTTKTTMSQNEVPILKEKIEVPASQGLVKQSNHAHEEVAPSSVSSKIDMSNRTVPAKSKSTQMDSRQALSSIIIPKPIRAIELAGSTVNSANQKAYESMLQQETDIFNKLKNSPIIDTMDTLDTTDLLTELSPTLVNCARGVSKTLTVMSKFTGGNIQCKRYEIQSFIDKRLYKKPEKNK